MDTKPNEKEVFIAGFKAGCSSQGVGLTRKNVEDNAEAAYQEYLKNRSEPRS